MLIDSLKKFNFAKFPRELVVLGSTGSIGCSTLEIARRFPEHFKVKALFANSNVEKLHQQIIEFQPEIAGLNLESAYKELKLKNNQNTKIIFGNSELVQYLSSKDKSVVVAGIVGQAGLAAVFSALNAGKLVALANKESLVVAGPLIKKLLESGSGAIIPVDSEHSAIFQCLQSEQEKSIKNLILTASGGPFRELEKGEFRNVTPAMAVKHPNWSMGAKISVDSATLMNKALELIEAYFLYGQDYSKLKVLVHPQSIIHSLVEFLDGSQLAQLSVPDMQGAIAYAINYPEKRLTGVMSDLNLAKLSKLEFFEVDHLKFPAISLGLKALERGSSAPAVFNLANELAVASFLEGSLRFDKISDFVHFALENCEFEDFSTLDHLLDYQTRQAEFLTKELKKLCS